MLFVNFNDPFLTFVVGSRVDFFQYCLESIIEELVPLCMDVMASSRENKNVNIWSLALYEGSSIIVEVGALSIIECDGDRRVHVNEGLLHFQAFLGPDIGVSTDTSECFLSTNKRKIKCF